MLDSLGHAEREHLIPGGWQEMLSEVDRMTDRLGLGVDPGIRETVAALNLLGYRTWQSCEGHVNERGHGLPSPWVELDLPVGEQDEAPVEVRAILAAVNAQSHVAVSERLRWDSGRIQAGGTFAELNASRMALRDGSLPPGEIAIMRASLVLRQREMRRFTAFLKAHLCGKAALPPIPAPGAYQPPPMPSV
jgi:hypothetical protein